ncbi:MAG TPA: glycogen/starch/alpha-glucan phosphorylase [Acetobacteraceae bacterium]|nr:glycogen/starch/alpha-glucan phosphorylase [Acetobacteraceae bacterium]
MWRNQHAWWRASVHNTAHVSWFSSDRAIREYCDNVWDVPLPR